MEIEISNSDVINYTKENTLNQCVNFLKKADSCDIKPHDRAYELSIKTIQNKERVLKRAASRSDANEIKHKYFLKDTYVFPKKHLSKCVPKLTCDESLDIEVAVKQVKRKTLEVCKAKKCLETKVSFLEEKVVGCENELQNKNAKIDSCKKELKRTAERERYKSNKILVLEQNVRGECCSENKNRAALLEQQLRQKEKEINELKQSVQYLEDIINDNNNEKGNVVLFDEKSKRYLPKLKECVYSLLNVQVSASKVSDVIQVVLKMVDIKANKLPSRTSVLDMSIQRLYLAHKQLIDVFSKDQNTVLLTDETSKFGSKFMGYEASDSEGKLWVLGLRDIATKSAVDTLDTFKEILNDLDESTQQGNTISQSIVSHIRATMSDRAATECKFNNLLYAFRKEILPLTYTHFDQFSPAEKLSLERMCNFFCGLHALVNFAETSKESVRESEKTIFDGETPCHMKRQNDYEPGVCRLVRTASKAFGVGSEADERSGCQGNFKTFAARFLHENHMRSLPLRSYRGSRFNILFSNAAALFFIQPVIKEFLEKFGAGNQLLKSVLFDLNTPELVAGVKALGLLSKLVTCPLWNVLEDKTVSITDMNEKYLQLVTFLDDASKNIQSFMKGELQVFGDETYIVKDQIYDSLVASDQYDNVVEVYLSVLLPALCKVSKKLFADHLPGGNLTDISNEMKQNLKNAPKTSCFAESVFGQLDHILRTKPNTCTLSAEASIMFLNNKTVDWLNTKSEEEKCELIKRASKSVIKIRQKYKERVFEIEERRKVAIQEQIRKQEAARLEKLRQQEEFTKDIIEHGLWQSINEVDNMLLSYQKHSDKVRALKSQLRFRKNVLHQVPTEKHVFNFSQKGKDFDIDQLTRNLKSLVTQAIVHDNGSQIHVLVGKRVRHRFNNKRGQVQWFTGKVISQVPSFPEWFNIIYDEDTAIYTYHHLDSDIGTADMQIIV